MTIQVGWDNDEEQQIIVHHFEGDWTWHECKNAMLTAMFLQESSTEGVNFIYDLSDSTLTTRDCLSQLQRLLKLEIFPVPRQIVIVDKSFRLNTMQNMLATIVRHREDVHFAEDIEKARDLLAF